MIWLGWIRYRRFHVSYLLGWLAAGICAGLLLARYADLSAGTAWLSVAAALAVGGLRNRRAGAIMAVTVAGMLIGLVRGSDFLRQLSGYETVIGQSVMMAGRVMADPGESSGGQMRLELGAVTIDGRPLPGEVYVTVRRSDLKRGDTVRVSADIREGFGSYQAAAYRADVREVQRPPDAIRDVREHFGASVRQVVSEPEASLGLGFVVGQRSSLPPELDEQLRMVGLTHIVVASGYNLTILVRFARRLLAGTSRFLATATSLFLMSGFAVFSGFSPSMNRAVIVTGLSLLAWHVGRRFHPLLLILYVAAGTSLWYPVYIWHDLGWYLSFLAFAGILMVAPVLMRLIVRGREAPALIQLVAETGAAQLMTLPLILVVFGQLPNLSVIANALVAPVIPFTMLVTVLAGVVGWGMPLLAPLIGWMAHISIGYVIAIVEWLAAVPGAQSEVTLSLEAALWGYAIIAAIVAALVWRLQISYRNRSIVE